MNQSGAARRRWPGVSAPRAQPWEGRPGRTPGHISRALYDGFASLDPALTRKDSAPARKKDRTRNGLSGPMAMSIGAARDY